MTFEGDYMKNRKELDKILSILPARIATAVSGICDSRKGDMINELRLRRDRPVSLTVDGKNIVLNIRCMPTEIKGAILALCGG